jgi:hypothetical protein
LKPEKTASIKKRKAKSKRIILTASSDESAGTFLLLLDLLVLGKLRKENHITQPLRVDSEPNCQS